MILSRHDSVGKGIWLLGRLHVDAGIAGRQARAEDLCRTKRNAIGVRMTGCSLSHAD